MTTLLGLLIQHAYAEDLQTSFLHNRHTGTSRGISADYKVDPKLIQWLKTNISKETGLPFSFSIPLESKKRVYQNMGEADTVASIIERMIVEEGLVIYDGAVRQIVFAMLGGDDNLAEASCLTRVFWEGGTGELFNLRAGYPMNNFIYDPKQPDAVSSNLEEKGKRGFIFRIINANGRYNTQDPLDGKTTFQGFPTWPTVHWEDWKPIAGENAWVAMASVQLYHKKYFQPALGTYRPDGSEAVELRLAEELARAALLLQAENGGIRMAPLGTYLTENDQGEGWYNLISTENNLSWYAAFRMLFQVTQKEVYRLAMNRLEAYFKQAWNSAEKCFYQGMVYRQGAWEPEKVHFATDVQTWGILVLGPEKIDEWFGQGAAYRLWEVVKEKSGALNSQGQLYGVGFTTEKDRVSVEWTAGAIFAAKALAVHYENNAPSWAQSAALDAQLMREGIETLRMDFPDQSAAYAYSSKRGWIPFGWNSHVPEVLSLASTAWMVLLDANFNPFVLPQLQKDKSLTEIEIARRP